ncbi:MAG: hypothetical protein N2B57_04345 [Planctomycetales bacterium]
MSTATTDIMASLHQILKSITEKREKLERGPIRVAAHQARVDDATSKLDATREQLTAARMLVDSKQLQLKTSEAKILDLQTKLNTCSNNREYQALLEQIAADQMAESVLEDEILECMENVDSLGQNVNDATSVVEDSKQQMKAESSRVDEEEGVLKSEIAQLTSDLSETENGLPEEIKPDYLRIVKTRKDDSLASVLDGICEGCFQQITPNMVAQLALKESVICTACGRLLYPSEIS